MWFRCACKSVKDCRRKYGNRKRSEEAERRERIKKRKAIDKAFRESFNKPGS